MNNVPCKGCLYRHIGCHSECKKDLRKAKAKEIDSDIWDGIKMSTKFRG